MRRLGRLLDTSRTFTWEIDEFNCRCFETDFRFDSPEIYFCYAEWCLTLHPNSKGNKDSVSMCLSRRYSDYGKHRVNCTITIEDSQGVEYISKEIDYTFSLYKMSKYFPDFIKKSAFFKDKLILSPTGSLTINCTISGYGVFTADQDIYNCHLTLIPEPTCVPKPEDKHDKDILPNEKGIYRMIRDFKGLLLDEHDFDVTLRVGTREFRVHKLILGARSPVFCSMFKHDTAERSTGIVDIPDCNPDAFQDFLLYLYSGRSERKDTDTVLDLYFAADKYGVDELKADCVEFMKKEMTVDNFGDVIKLAVRHNEPSLIKKATFFFMHNIKEIIVTVKWQSFIIENPIAANELNIKALNGILIC